MPTHLSAPKLDPHEREALMRRVAQLKDHLDNLYDQSLTCAERARVSLLISEKLGAALRVLGDDDDYSLVLPPVAIPT